VEPLGTIEAIVALATALLTLLGTLRYRQVHSALEDIGAKDLKKNPYRSL